MGILIGLTGRAGVGKDLVASHLQRQYQFKPMAFATPLKKAAAQVFGIEEIYFHDRSLKESVAPHWGITPRHMMQVLGTEGVRNNFGQDFWVKRWLLDYAAVGESENVVVTDIRFANEARVVQDLGGVMVHITRPGFSNAAVDHESESGVPFNARTDHTLTNDSSIRSLFKKVDDLFVYGVGA